MNPYPRCNLSHKGKVWFQIGTKDLWKLHSYGCWLLMNLINSCNKKINVNQCIHLFTSLRESFVYLCHLSFVSFPGNLKESWIWIWNRKQEWDHISLYLLLCRWIIYWELCFVERPRHLDIQHLNVRIKPTYIFLSFFAMYVMSFKTKPEILDFYFLSLFCEIVSVEVCHTCRWQQRVCYNGKKKKATRARRRLSFHRNHIERAVGGELVSCRCVFISFFFFLYNFC